MSTDHKIAKPVVFISHASSDAPFANAVMAEIQKVFASGIDVFCTSSPGAIMVGRDWLSGIEENLAVAKAVIAIVTPTSIERPWLWFEIGATWSKGRGGECSIYPLCAREVDISDLPSPLDRLQALSLGKATDLKMLFEALINQFGFGNIKSFKATNIMSRVPKYNQIQVNPVDQEERVFYTGEYKGYTDDELRDVLKEKFVDREWLDHSYGLQSSLFHNRLVHYREIDKRMDLPVGTTKRHLTSLMAEYDYVPLKETINTVRFVPDDAEAEIEAAEESVRD